jgi:hypothetical protein
MTGKQIREEYQKNKEFYNDLFDDITKEKYAKCTIKDKFGKGKDGFDYLKMAQTIENGEW